MLTMTDTASNVNRFRQSVCKLDRTHLRTDSTAAANMGLNESGGAVLRRTIIRIFEQWCFVESAVLKCPAFVKPRNVIGNPNRPPCRHQPTDQNPTTHRPTFPTRQPTLLYFYFSQRTKKMKF